MVNRLEAEPNQPCIWMSAGLLSYKLCDRDFDCENCPLDAALRGASPVARTARPAKVVEDRGADVQFPEDRRYSAGHTWLQEVDGRRKAYRFGLDGFGAALIGCPRVVRWNVDGETVRPGETACTIEFDGGVLHLGIPVSARVSGHNQVLDVDPAALVNAPYGGGWIMELVQVQKGDLEPLLTAEEAQKQARLDLRRFRRRIALHLLADSSGLGPTLADGGELVADPWCILGGPRYLELLRELIH